MERKGCGPKAQGKDQVGGGKDKDGLYRSVPVLRDCSKDTEGLDHFICVSFEMTFIYRGLQM